MVNKQEVGDRLVSDDGTLGGWTQAKSG